MKAVVIEAPAGTSLNFLSDFVFDEKPGVPDRASRFELQEGYAADGGSGDPVILKIIIEYVDPTEEDLEDVREIIARAVSSAKDVIVSGNWDQD